MTGARIQVDFQVQGFADGLKRLGELAGDTAPLMKMIGVGLVETTQHRFETATDPHGNPWKGLSAAYAEFKTGPGILRESAMRGGLMGSITYELQGGHQVAVGSNKIYAAIHQFGGVIAPKNAKALVFKLGNRTVRARRVTIPARPYLGFGEADQVVVHDAVDFVFGRAWSGA